MLALLESASEFAGVVKFRRLCGDFTHLSPIRPKRGLVVAQVSMACGLGRVMPQLETRPLPQAVLTSSGRGKNFREQSVNAGCLKAQLSGERPRSLLARTLPAAGGYE
jgi:hypothetical protein